MHKRESKAVNNSIFNNIKAKKLIFIIGEIHHDPSPSAFVLTLMSQIKEPLTCALEAPEDLTLDNLFDSYSLTDKINDTVAEKKPEDQKNMVYDKDFFNRRFQIKNLLKVLDKCRKNKLINYFGLEMNAAQLQPIMELQHQGIKVLELYNLRRQHIKINLIKILNTQNKLNTQNNIVILQEGVYHILDLIEDVNSVLKNNNKDYIIFPIFVYSDFVNRMDVQKVLNFLSKSDKVIAYKAEVKGDVLSFDFTNLNKILAIKMNEGSLKAAFTAKALSFFTNRDLAALGLVNKAYQVFVRDELNLRKIK